ncbi:hypothetical protein F4781DRAFT_440219 [Annulohypoxylon bovei var. microspora]|nr:hypothetical protein F4781DRAFT_440219 [Annulohypoxylon bovei var. microspora]
MDTSEPDGQYECKIEHDSIYIKFMASNPDTYYDQLLRISFQRSIRVPDNASESMLRPFLDSFPLFKVQDYAHRFPSEVVAKGGFFTSMYQTEAMWIDISARAVFMIKLYIGGFNAVLGDRSMEDIQTKFQRLKLVEEGESTRDCAVMPSQLWLNGRLTSPGIVRQSVSMPMDQGDSMKAQLSRKGVIASLQIKITPTIGQKRLSPRRLTSPKGNFFINIELLTHSIHPIPCSPSDLIVTIKNGDTIIMKFSYRSEVERLWERDRKDITDATHWMKDQTITISVHILNSASFLEVTGRNPPHPQARLG